MLESDANAWGTAGTKGKGILYNGSDSNAPKTSWWYMTASCDEDGSSSVNTWFTTASSTTVVAVVKEHN